MYPFRIFSSDPYYPAIAFTQHLICALVNPYCHFDMANNSYGLDKLMIGVYKSDLLDAQQELFEEREQVRLLESLEV